MDPDPCLHVAQARLSEVARANHHHPRVTIRTDGLSMMNPAKGGAGQPTHHLHRDSFRLQRSQARLLHAALARHGELPVRKDSDLNSSPARGDQRRHQLRGIEGVGRNPHLAPGSRHGFDRSKLRLAGLHQMGNRPKPHRQLRAHEGRGLRHRSARCAVLGLSANHRRCQPLNQRRFFRRSSKGRRQLPCSLL